MQSFKEPLHSATVKFVQGSFKGFDALQRSVMTAADSTTLNEAIQTASAHYKYYLFSLLTCTVALNSLLSFFLHCRDKVGIFVEDAFTLLEQAQATGVIG